MVFYHNESRKRQTEKKYYQLLIFYLEKQTYWKILLRNFYRTIGQHFQISQHCIRSFTSLHALSKQKYTLFMNSLFLFNKYKYLLFKNLLQFFSRFRRLLTNYTLKLYKLSFLQSVPYFSLILNCVIIQKVSVLSNKLFTCISGLKNVSILLLSWVIWTVVFNLTLQSNDHKPKCVSTLVLHSKVGILKFWSQAQRNPKCPHNHS